MNVKPKQPGLVQTEFEKQLVVCQNCVIGIHPCVISGKPGFVGLDLHKCAHKGCSEFLLKKYGTKCKSHTCAKCGKEFSETDKWTKCIKCGKAYCYDHGLEKEKLLK